MAWQFAVVILAFVSVGGFVVRVEAQSAPPKTLAPFTVWSGDGTKPLLTIGETKLPGSPVAGATLEFYADGRPNAYLLTTAETYKKTTEQRDNVLNELKTYLVDRDSGWAKEGNPNAAYQVSSLALTSAGGSFVLLNRPEKAGAIPTHAARLTATKDVGGMVILSLKDGKTETIPKQ